MAEEEEEEVKKPSTARKASWTPESHDSYKKSSRNRDDRNVDGRESRDSRENEERKAISVIRINPNEMSRLRKDSEKYADNHSDNESYGSHSRGNRSRDNYGSRGDGYRPRGGGRGDYRGRKTSYDPDYDRSVAYRRRDDNQREVTIGGDRVGDRPRDNKYGNMSHLIKQLKKSYLSCSAPPSTHENRHKKECLALFREYTLNDPESILSLKLDPSSQEKIEAAVSQKWPFFCRLLLDRTLLTKNNFSSGLEYFTRKSSCTVACSKTAPKQMQVQFLPNSTICYTMQ